MNPLGATEAGGRGAGPSEVGGAATGRKPTMGTTVATRWGGGSKGTDSFAEFLEILEALGHSEAVDEARKESMEAGVEGISYAIDEVAVGQVVIGDAAVGDEAGGVQDADAAPGEPHRRTYAFFLKLLAMSDAFEVVDGATAEVREAEVEETPEAVDEAAVGQADVSQEDSRGADHAAAEDDAAEDAGEAPREPLQGILGLNKAVVEARRELREVDEEWESNAVDEAAVGQEGSRGAEYAAANHGAKQSDDEAPQEPLRGTYAEFLKLHAMSDPHEAVEEAKRVLREAGVEGASNAVDEAGVGRDTVSKSVLSQESSRGAKYAAAEDGAARAAREATRERLQPTFTESLNLHATDPPETVDEARRDLREDGVEGASNAVGGATTSQKGLQGAEYAAEDGSAREASTASRESLHHSFTGFLNLLATSDPHEAMEEARRELSEAGVEEASTTFDAAAGGQTAISKEGSRGTKHAAAEDGAARDAGEAPWKPLQGTFTEIMKLHAANPNQATDEARRLLGEAATEGEPCAVDEAAVAQAAIGQEGSWGAEYAAEHSITRDASKAPRESLHRTFTGFLNVLATSDPHKIVEKASRELSESGVEQLSNATDEAAVGQAAVSQESSRGDEYAATEDCATRDACEAPRGPLQGTFTEIMKLHATDFHEDVDEAIREHTEAGVEAASNAVDEASVGQEGSRGGEYATEDGAARDTSKVPRESLHRTFTEFLNLLATSDPHKIVEEASREIVEAADGQAAVGQEDSPGAEYAAAADGAARDAGEAPWETFQGTFTEIMKLRATYPHEAVDETSTELREATIEGASYAVDEAAVAQAAVGQEGSWDVQYAAEESTVRNASKDPRESLHRTFTGFLNVLATSDPHKIVEEASREFSEFGVEELSNAVDAAVGQAAVSQEGPWGAEYGKTEDCAARDAGEVSRGPLQGTVTEIMKLHATDPHEGVDEASREHTEDGVEGASNAVGEATVGQAEYATEDGSARDISKVPRESLHRNYTEFLNLLAASDPHKIVEEASRQLSGSGVEEASNAVVEVAGGQAAVNQEDSRVAEYATVAGGAVRDAGEAPRETLQGTFMEIMKLRTIDPHEAVDETNTELREATIEGALYVVNEAAVGQADVVQKGSRDDEFATKERAAPDARNALRESLHRTFTEFLNVLATSDPHKIVEEASRELSEFGDEEKSNAFDEAAVSQTAISQEGSRVAEYAATEDCAARDAGEAPREPLQGTVTEIMKLHATDSPEGVDKASREHTEAGVEAASKAVDDAAIGQASVGQEGLRGAAYATEDGAARDTSKAPRESLHRSFMEFLNLVVSSDPHKIVVEASRELSESAIEEASNAVVEASGSQAAVNQEGSREAEYAAAADGAVRDAGEAPREPLQGTFAETMKLRAMDSHEAVDETSTELREATIEGASYAVDEAAVVQTAVGPEGSWDAEYATTDRAAPDARKAPRESLHRTFTGFLNSLATSDPHKVVEEASRELSEFGVEQVSNAVDVAAVSQAAVSQEVARGADYAATEDCAARDAGEAPREPLQGTFTEIMKLHATDSHEAIVEASREHTEAGVEAASNAVDDATVRHAAVVQEGSKGAKYATLEGSARDTSKVPRESLHGTFTEFLDLLATSDPHKIVEEANMELSESAIEEASNAVVEAAGSQAVLSQEHSRGAEYVTAADDAVRDAGETPREPLQENFVQTMKLRGKDSHEAVDETSTELRDATIEGASYAVDEAAVGQAAVGQEGLWDMDYATTDSTARDARKVPRESLHRTFTEFLNVLATSDPHKIVEEASREFSEFGVEEASNVVDEAAVSQAAVSQEGSRCAEYAATEDCAAQDAGEASREPLQCTFTEIMMLHTTDSHQAIVETSREHTEADVQDASNAIDEAAVGHTAVGKEGSRAAEYATEDGAARDTSKAPRKSLHRTFTEFLNLLATSDPHKIVEEANMELSESATEEASNTIVEAAGGRAAVSQEHSREAEYAAAADGAVRDAGEAPREPLEGTFTEFMKLRATDSPEAVNETSTELRQATIEGASYAVDEAAVGQAANGQEGSWDAEYAKKDSTSCDASKAPRESLHRKFTYAFDGAAAGQVAVGQQGSQGAEYAAEVRAARDASKAPRESLHRTFTGFLNVLATSDPHDSVAEATRGLSKVGVEEVSNAVDDCSVSQEGSPGAKYAAIEDGAARNPGEASRETIQGTFTEMMNLRATDPHEAMDETRIDTREAAMEGAFYVNEVAVGQAAVGQEGLQGTEYATEDRAARDAIKTPRESLHRSFTGFLNVLATSDPHKIVEEANRELSESGVEEVSNAVDEAASSRGGSRGAEYAAPEDCAAQDPSEAPQESLQGTFTEIIMPYATDPREAVGETSTELREAAIVRASSTVDEATVGQEGSRGAEYVAEESAPRDASKAPRESLHRTFTGFLNVLVTSDPNKIVKEASRELSEVLVEEAPNPGGQAAVDQAVVSQAGSPGAEYATTEDGAARDSGEAPREPLQTTLTEMMTLHAFEPYEAVDETRRGDTEPTNEGPFYAQTDAVDSRGGESAAAGASSASDADGAPRPFARGSFEQFLELLATSYPSEAPEAVTTLLDKAGDRAPSDAPGARKGAAAGGDELEKMPNNLRKSARELEEASGDLKDMCIATPQLRLRDRRQSIPKVLEADVTRLEKEKEETVSRLNLLEARDAAKATREPPQRIFSELPKLLAMSDPYETVDEAGRELRDAGVEEACNAVDKTTVGQAVINEEGSRGAVHAATEDGTKRNDKEASHEPLRGSYAEFLKLHVTADPHEAVEEARRELLEASVEGASNTVDQAAVGQAAVGQAAFNEEGSRGAEYADTEDSAKQNAGDVPREPLRRTFTKFLNVLAASDACEAVKEARREFREVTDEGASDVVGKAIIDESSVDKKGSLGKLAPDNVGGAQGANHPEFLELLAAYYPFEAAHVVAREPGDAHAEGASNAVDETDAIDSSQDAGSTAAGSGNAPDADGVPQKLARGSYVEFLELIATFRSSEAVDAVTRGIDEAGMGRTSDPARARKGSTAVAMGGNKLRKVANDSRKTAGDFKEAANNFVDVRPAALESGLGGRWRSVPEVCWADVARLEREKEEAVYRLNLLEVSITGLQSQVESLTANVVASKGEHREEMSQREERQTREVCRLRDEIRGLLVREERREGLMRRLEQQNKSLVQQVEQLAPKNRNKGVFSCFGGSPRPVNG